MANQHRCPETSNQYHPQSRPHPGETLAEKLEELGMGRNEFALRTGKPEKTIIAVLKGDSSITPEMAVQFERVTAIPAGFWLTHQRSYDEYVARKKYMEVIQAATSWARRFPLHDMIKHGWLPPAKSIEDRAAGLLAFFGFAYHAAWDEYYCQQHLRVAFRISLAHAKEQYAVSAWLRQGEHQASALQSGDYSEQRFKEALPTMKTLMASHPEDLFRRLQAICLEAGVKLVHTLCIKKAPIIGATRWLGSTPLIQLSGRQNRNGTFWFTFFHEAGHILLHGKRGVFLEYSGYDDQDREKEQEADSFAVKWTLSKSEEQIVLATRSRDREAILSFAREFNTHPGIIIGRLQHLKLIPHSMGKEFIKPVIFQ
jgi:addiction module HigA family antidote